MLVAQAKLKANQLGLRDLMITCLDSEDCPDFDETVVIFDEYYDALVGTDLSVTQDGKLFDVFWLPIWHSMIVTTATYSPTFEKFLVDVAGSVVTLSEEKESKSFDSIPASFQLAIKCKPSRDQVNAEAVELIL
jgi:hypothetical protein